MGLIILALFVGVIEINKANADFRFSESDSIIILGHSHAECAFDDSLLDGTANFANSGESFFYTWIKLRELIRQNPQINRVVLEVSNNQIDKNIEEWIYGDKYLSKRLVDYYQFMDNKERLLLLKNNRESFVKGASKAFRRSFFKIVLKDYSYVEKLGGYVALDQKLDLTQIDPSEIKMQGEVSELNIKYLKKIVSLCQSQDVVLTFVRVPQHKRCVARENEVVFLKVLHDSFGSVPFYDFNNFHLEDSLYSDFGHLNKHGAVVFTNTYGKLVDSGMYDLKSADSLLISIDLCGVNF